MGVGPPRIGQRHAAREVSELGHCRGPEPERAVHMDPGTVPPGNLNGGLEGVEGSGVEVAGLETDQRGPGPFRQQPVQLGGDQPALGICGDRGGPPETEVPEAQVNGLVALLAHKAPDPRGPCKASSVEVPASISHQPPPGSGQPGEVGHGGSCSEPDVGILGQVQELQEPVPGRLLDGRDGGSGVAHARVLVPRAD